MAKATLNQADDAEIVTALTAIVREADEAFQKSGGSSRHWVRDNFLPKLNSDGWQLIIPRCKCGEMLRFIDGQWMDAETHTTCAGGGGRKHRPTAASAPRGPQDER